MLPDQPQSLAFPRIQTPYAIINPGLINFSAMSSRRLHTDCHLNVVAKSLLMTGNQHFTLSLNPQGSQAVKKDFSQCLRDTLSSTLVVSDYISSLCRRIISANTQSVRSINRMIFLRSAPLMAAGMRGNKIWNIIGSFVIA
ncbi:hypothetical protein AV903_18455 [Erwinia tracheiphila]|uniref:Uncharacterized protein n=1 Tax=Erwinia tracheiphila TaxID=65700 RepID=A0A345CVV1_9GAMM|nr:hypothetical protein AV903_18455 [Erwinia tracheiphila]